MAMINIDPGLIPHLPEVNSPVKLPPRENFKAIRIYPKRRPWSGYYPDPGFGPVPMPSWPRKPDIWDYWDYYDPDPGFSPWPDDFPDIPPEFGPVPMPSWSRKPRDWYYYDPQTHDLLMRYDPFNPTRPAPLMANKDNPGADAGEGYTYDSERGKLILGITKNEYLEPPPSPPPVKPKEPQDPQEPKDGITKEQVKSAINNILNITSTTTKAYSELSRQRQGAPGYNPMPNINTNPKIGGDLPLDVPPPAFEQMPYFDSNSNNTRRKPIVTEPPSWMQPFTTSLNPNNLYDPDYSIHYDGLYNLMDAGINSIASIPEVIKNLPQGLMDYGNYLNNSIQSYGGALRQNPYRTILDTQNAFNYGAARTLRDNMQDSVNMLTGLASTYTGKKYKPYQLPDIRNMPHPSGGTYENRYSDLEAIAHAGSIGTNLAELTLGGFSIGKTIKGVKRKSKKKKGKLPPEQLAELCESTENLSPAEIRDRIKTTIKEIEKSKELLSEELERAKDFVRYCPKGEKHTVKIKGVTKSFKHLRDLEKKGLKFTKHGQYRLITNINRYEVSDVNFIKITKETGQRYFEKKKDEPGFKIIKTKIINSDRYVVVLDEHTDEVVTFFRADTVNLLKTNTDSEKWTIIKKNVE